VAHYYFHLDQCGSVTSDLEGLELPDLGVARATAIAAARDIMAGELVTGSLCLACWIDIADAEGKVLLAVPFKEAIQVTGL
jgi:hypothetical protein